MNILEPRTVYKPSKSSVPIEGTSYWVDKDSTIYNKKGQPMKPRLNKKTGYLAVNLYVDGKYRTKTIHSLVAKAFIPNPENKVSVNHVDGNKTNNSLDNLEWASWSENMQHAYDKGLNRSKTRPINQYTLEGEYVARFEHSRQIRDKLGINRRNLVQHLKTGKGTVGGYVWRYA